MPKLSIIVPIYNVAPFLDRSIKSLINQTLKDIEIILINDGSTDNSLTICRKYQDIDDRIIIIDKKNEGVSATRNKGIEVATSEYITFMDPDDYISIFMYENMYKNIIDNKCDICLCNYTKIMPNKKNTIINLPYKEGVYLESDIKELMLSMISGDGLDGVATMGSTCRAIFKKNLINQYSIEFPRDTRFMEDLVFVMDYLSRCSKMYINENSYYYYCLRESSAVTGYKKSMWESNKKVDELLINILDRNDILNNANMKFKYRIINSAIGAILNEVHIDNEKNLKYKILSINDIILDKDLQSSIRCLNNYNISIKKKIILILIKYRLSLPLCVFLLIRKRMLYWIRNRMICK